MASPYNVIKVQTTNRICYQGKRNGNVGGGRVAVELVLVLGLDVGCWGLMLRLGLGVGLGE